MKKILLTIGLVSLAVISSQAQGYVLFSSSTQNISTNNTAGIITTQASTSGKTLGAGNYYYALFWSATGNGITTAIQGNTTGYAWTVAGWTADTDATAAAASTGTAGRLAATAPNGDGSTTVAGITGGNPYYFAIVGWSASLGTTLAQAEQNASTGIGYIGQSAVSGAITTGNGGSIPAPLLMGGGAPSIQAFTLGAVAPVPEPTTMAMAALGGASLLLFRRRK